MKTEILKVNRIKYLVKIHYEHKYRARASIGKSAINIRIPSFLDREKQFKILQYMKAWARKKIQENPEKFKTEIQKEHKDGDILKVGGRKYLLKIGFRDKRSSFAQVVGDVIKLVISSNLSQSQQNRDISILLSKCIASEAFPALQRKIEALNKRYFNQRINKIFFKYTKSIWGSCSKAGNINISTRLLFAPKDVFEYVCLHELAHLIEPNHSARFWALVKKAMPDYKEKIKWLKENGHKCRF